MSEVDNKEHIEGWKESKISSRRNIKKETEKEINGPNLRLGLVTIRNIEQAAQLLCQKQG